MVDARRPFGRRKPGLRELTTALRPTPDADGVTRVFSKELWDDPQIGDFLSKMGKSPDDPRNRVATAENHIARFARAREALMERTDAFIHKNAKLHGHCNARPMLIVAPEIWDGPHGAFLYGQLDLCGYDDWNVLMCGGDSETISRCGLVGHPGSIPALTQALTEKIIDLKGRYQQAHDALGNSILGRTGIDSKEFNRIIDGLRQELIDYVDFCRSKTIEILSRRGPTER